MERHGQLEHCCRCKNVIDEGKAYIDNKVFWQGLPDIPLFLPIVDDKVNRICNAGSLVVLQILPAFGLETLDIFEKKRSELQAVKAHRVDDIFQALDDGDI